MNNTHSQMNIKDKYKNISAFTFTTTGKELMVVFNGFEEDEDLKEFADFIFAKIKMQYFSEDKTPSFH